MPLILHTGINSAIYAYVSVGVVSLFGIQYLLLILLLFYRLYIIFHLTTYKLSRCTILSFILCYILLIILAISTVIIRITYLYQTYWLLIVGLPLVLITLALFIQIVVLFSYKLMIAAQESNTKKSNDALIETITRNFILTICSIISMVIYAIMTTLRSNNDSIALGLASGIFFGLDLITNFLSVMLGFAMFDASYFCLCGPCDKKCVACCSKQIRPTIRAMHSKSSITQIPSTSSAAQAIV